MKKFLIFLLGIIAALIICVAVVGITSVCRGTAFFDTAHSAVNIIAGWFGQ